MLLNAFGVIEQSHFITKLNYQTDVVDLKEELFFQSPLTRFQHKFTHSFNALKETERETERERVENFCKIEKIKERGKYSNMSF